MNFRAKWMPPGGWDSESADCTRAVWIQYWGGRLYTGDSASPKTNRWPILLFAPNGWGKDWDETDFAGSNPAAWAWNLSVNSATDSTSNSTMWDDPRALPTTTLKPWEMWPCAWRWDFRARAGLKCIAGTDSGEYYAIIDWGFEWRKSSSGLVTIIKPPGYHKVWDDQTEYAPPNAFQLQVPPPPPLPF